jgi:hypothetical protein
MDYNADIEARRRQLQQAAQDRAASLRRQEMEREMELARFNELGKKFARWVKLSGVQPTRYETVGEWSTGRRNVTQGDRIAVCAIKKTSIPYNEWTGFADSYRNSGYCDQDVVAIDENGEIMWMEGNERKTASNLWNYIADFIARSESTVRWPD